MSNRKRNPLGSLFSFLVIVMAFVIGIVAIFQHSVRLRVDQAVADAQGSTVYLENAEDRIDYCRSIGITEGAELSLYTEIPVTVSEFNRNTGEVIVIHQGGFRDELSCDDGAFYHLNELFTRKEGTNDFNRN